MTACSIEHPYPGLRPFEPKEAEWFHGRETEIERLAGMIDNQRFVAVLGSSGAGKSSLVLAGVLPALGVRAAVTVSDSWHLLRMRPGGSPFRSLAQTAAVLGCQLRDEPEAVPVWRDRALGLLRRSSSGLLQIVTELRLHPGARVLLLVDQFEELFRFIGRDRRAARHADDEARDRGDEAAAFVAALLETTRGETPVHVVMTMRSDFVGECARFHGLPEAVDAGQFLVPRMTRAQLGEAVRGPLRRAKASISPALVQRVLNDAGTKIDALPVMQHALMRTWDIAGNNWPTVSAAGGLAEAAAPYDAALMEASEGYVFERMLLPRHYKDAGTMQAALSKHADDILGDLKDQRCAEIAPWIFRALSDIDKEGRAIRRPQRFADLVALLGLGSRLKVKMVIDRFRSDDCNFLTPSFEAVQRLKADTVVDIAHEALLRNWSKICGDRVRKGWLAEEFEDGLVWRSLLVQARSFAADRNAVLSPATTAERADWLAKRPSHFWAGRHTERHRGDGWASVNALISASQLNSRRENERRQWLNRIYIGFAIVLTMISIFAAFQTWNANQQTLKVEANSYWQRLQLFGDTLRPEHVDTLWELSRSRNTVREEFVHQLINGDALTRQFSMNPLPIVRAVGLEWPKAAKHLTLEYITALVARPPVLGDRFAIWQTLSNVGAIVALADRLEGQPAQDARTYVQQLLMAAADRASVDSSRLLLAAQIAHTGSELVDPGTMSSVRAKLGKAIDEALLQPIRSADPNVAIGIATGASLPPHAVNRAWASFDFLMSTVTTGNPGFWQSRIVRLIGPLVAELQPIRRPRSQGRQLYDIAAAILAAAAVVTTDNGDPTTPLLFVDTINHLAPRLDVADAPAVDDRLSRALSSYDGRDRPAVLARAGTALAVRLSGANLPLSAPKLAEIAIGGRNDGNGPAFEAALWALGSTANLAEPPLQPLYRLLQPLTPGERGYRPAALAAMLAIAAPRLSTSEAISLRDAAVKALQNAADPFAREGLANLLTALCPKLGPDGQDVVLAAARSALAATGSPEEATAWARLIGQNLPKEPEIVLVRETVELLKYPTATGEATKTLLQSLDEGLSEASRPTDRWLADMPIPELVAWLHRQYGAAVNLSGAPEQPPPLQPTPRAAAAGRV